MITVLAFLLSSFALWLSNVVRPIELSQEKCEELPVAYTDFWQSYKTVIPSERHQAVGKQTGQTNHIERLNNTFKQRVSRAGKSKSIILQKA